LGVLPIGEALRIAREANLDLVEVSPNANPPVTRVLDFGKFLYEQSKKEREARKSQKQVEVKEVRLRPKTNEHHLGFKIKQARGWLEDGNKVKVRVRFRGREITYPEVAIEQLNTITEDLDDVAAVEQAPQLDGRTMLMILAPKKK
jgi:translation initiation factor IF-3